MGNIGSNSASARRRHHNHSLEGPVATGAATLQHQPQQRPPPPPDMSSGNQYVFAAASPYPHQYPSPSPPPYPNAGHPQYPNPGPTPGYYSQYPGYYQHPPPMPTPLPAPYLQHHPQGRPMPLDPHHQMSWGGGPRFAHQPLPVQPPPPYIEHQKAVTIRNVVNLKKETLRIEPDEKNPGQFLVSFTFDATVPGSITVIFFAKEEFECNLKPMKPELLPPDVVPFADGLGQKFRQQSGKGIDFSAFDEIELLKEGGEMEVFPLVVKAEAIPDNDKSNSEYQKAAAPNSQITQAVFEKKENGEYHVRVVKQILWVGGVRYELQEIYGIGNSVDNDFDGSDPGKECVICLSEPRDTTVLPCRHMCMCSGCAKLLRLQTNRCPICRQPVERLLEIKVNNKPDEQPGEHSEE